MGFCRLIYRIGRMIFRDFLFKIPKKYLVIVIVFLTMFIFKTTVFGADVNIPDGYIKYSYNNINREVYFYSENNLGSLIMCNSEGKPIYLYYRFSSPKYSNGVITFSGSCFRMNYNPSTTIEGRFVPDYSYTRVNDIPIPTGGFVLFSNRDIFEGNTTNIYLEGNTLNYRYVQDYLISPSITNDTNDINNWSFDYLLINGGSLKASNDYGNNYFTLEQIYNGNTSYINIDNYYTELNGVLYFTIPRNILLTDNAIVNGRTITFNIIYQKAVEGGNNYITYELGTYTLGLTQTEQDNINEDKTQQMLDNISQAQQQTTNAINDLNNNITNDNVSNSVIQQPDVPTDTTGVENGVNNIFNVIMNAFTNFDSSQDVVFPIPFTNKNITISGNYTRDMLTSVNANWVINFITIFWWYIISVYIIKDILKTVDKIQEGNIDKVENSNIKGDML